MGRPVGSDMIEQRGDIGPRSVARSLDIFFDVGLHGLIPSFELRGRRDPKLRQAISTALERASLHPRLDFLAGPIGTDELVVEIRADVFAPTIGHAFKKERTAARAQI